MNKLRIRHLIIAAALSLLYLIGLFVIPLFNHNNTNHIGLLCIVVIFSLFWLIPNVLQTIEFRKHFVENIASVLYRMFHCVFWSNLIMTIIPITTVGIRFSINVVLYITILILICVSILFELKPRIGIATKKEIKNLNYALEELNIACSIMPDLNTKGIDGICVELKKMIEKEQTLFHGIDTNILSECRTIRNAVLCKDSDSLNMHIALLESLIYVAKQ